MQQRFIQAWKAFGIENAALAATGAALAARYDEPQRHYHTRAHLQDVLAKLDWARDNVTAPASMFDTVELALWYHDAVYDPTRHDNEARSCDLFLADAAQFGLPANITADVARLIDVTASHKNAAAIDEMIMCDCDLAILGETPAVFKAYDAAIRREYAHVPDAVYTPLRRQVLQGFLQTPRLYKTTAFHERYDAQARCNLTPPAPPAAAPKP